MIRHRMHRKGEATGHAGPGPGPGPGAGPGLGTTDAAALAAASLAIVLTTYLDEGAYDLFGALVSATLVWTLLAYLLGRTRNSAETAAFAGIVALTAMPLMCFVIELVNSPGPAGFFTGVDPVSHSEPSRVGSLPTALAFVLAALMVSWVEVRFRGQLKDFSGATHRGEIAPDSPARKLLAGVQR